MFSQIPTGAVASNTRKRSGLRNPSRFSSTGASANRETSQSGQSRQGSLLGVRSASIGHRNRSITPLPRGTNALQALSIAEEQTIALEEGLKQATQAASGSSILLQDEFHVVTSHSRLPSDVEQMLSQSGMLAVSFCSGLRRQ